MNWKEKLRLNEGDKTDSVKYIVETDTKFPFKESRSVAQYDKDSNQIIFENLS